jgi:Cytochrome c
MSRRKRVGAWMAVASIAAMAAIVGAERNAAAKEGMADPVVERGHYLVKIMLCNDCHTPLKMGPKGPEPDMARMLSGHPEGMTMPPPPQLAPDAPWNWSGAATLTAFSGPWGISYARNLTPDKETGLGDWTEEQFVRANRTGKHQGVENGREILPPMPWPWYRELSDEDLHAVWTYLRSIPPIHNNAPQSIPAPPPPAH